MLEVCDTYRTAIELYLNQGVHTVSIDEQTGIQALERFGTLRKKLTRYGSFSSLTDLQDRILRFIEYYNQTMAKPYRWTCNGALLCK